MAIETDDCNIAELLVPGPIVQSVITALPPAADSLWSWQNQHQTNGTSCLYPGPDYFNKNPLVLLIADRAGPCPHGFVWERATLKVYANRTEGGA